MRTRKGTSDISPTLQESQNKNFTIVLSDFVYWIKLFKIQMCTLMDDSTFYSRKSSLMTYSHRALASTPLIYFEWSDVKRCRTELWVHHVASLALFAAEMQASANQIALCKYPSIDASQTRSCNTRKVCWLAVVTMMAHHHQASDKPS